MLKPKAVDEHIFTKQVEKVYMLSARKLMRKRVLMVEFMQQGTTVTSEEYCETHTPPPNSVSGGKRKTK
jgi:hypothetical protein